MPNISETNGTLQSNLCQDMQIKRNTTAKCECCNSCLCICMYVLFFLVLVTVTSVSLTCMLAVLIQWSGRYNMS